jgi:hypothetical protein
LCVGYTLFSLLGLFNLSGQTYLGAGGGGGGTQHVCELQILYGKPDGKERLVNSRGRF